LRIVALRALGLGDLLTAVPALRALRDAWPHAEVTVAAPAALRPLARLAGCGLVDAAPLQPLPPSAHGADLLVNLHGRGPQSHRVALAARPRRLVAFTHDDVAETAGMPRWEADEHEVARWCRLLRESGIPAEPARLALPAPPLPAGLRSQRGATVVHPGAASAARRWPAERFARVAAAEAAAGRQVVLTGGPDERALAADVARRATLPAEAVLAGRTTLAELAAIVAHAGRVVCGDTGVAHLATAFGRPSVVLFGPTSPERWGPLAPPADPARHRVLWAGRTGDPHASEPHEGLLEIEPGAVLAELAALPS
jgi:ADP-heptose:LPS heptosyltransferase